MVTQQMTEHLASIVLWYSAWEYVFRRLFVSSRPIGGWWKLLRTNLLLSLLLTLGTVAFVSIGYVTAYLLLAIVGTIIEKQSKTIPLEFSRWILKQALALIVLWTSWRLLEPQPVHSWYTSIQEAILPPMVSTWMQNHLVSICVIIASYFFMIDGGTNIVKGLLSNFPVLYKKAMQSLKNGSKTSGAGAAREGEEENAGEWIGALERIITLTFVLTSSFTAIAFALTAKSIARFNELEDKSFAEYYLLGTSSSIAVAMIAGMLVKIALGL